MEAPLVATIGYGVVAFARSLVFPALVCWGLSHVALGVSLSYVGRCAYLEFLLRVRRSAIGAAAAARPASAAPSLTEAQRTAPLRGVAVLSQAQYASTGQTVPPSKRVSELFKERQPPLGEELPYLEARGKRSLLSAPWHIGRPPKEEAVEGPVEDEAWQHRLRCLREGAEVHRQVRQYVQQRVRPGMELREIAEMVEKAGSALVGFDAKNPLRCGWAFPTGISLNEVAAHDSVNPGDPPRWLLPTDLVKLDFGIHVEGHILDCAFSFTFDPQHDGLMQAVKEATNEGIRHAGPDALVSEVGARIQEVMEAGEVHRPDGKVLPVYSIKNLTGHSIAPYRIHAGKSLPSTATGGRVRMLAGELWAVETFGTAGGVGYVTHGDGCSHFMRPTSSPPNRLQTSVLSPSAKELLELIDSRFSTLAFCPRWIVQEATRRKSALLRPAAGGGGGGGARDAQRWWSGPLEELCNVGIVAKYPPLVDLQGSHTAQYEHTVLLRGRGKEVLTRGSDY